MAAVSVFQIGFECKFAKDPPEWLQTECPLCLHILRQPYQVTCCGKSFCKECIERVKANNKPCPCCKGDNFNDFPNKGLQQPLYGFPVYCSNKEEGCEWTGELGYLDKHLNNITPDEEFEGCLFAEIQCTYCSGTVTRKGLLYHKVELCNKRPFSCEYCNDYESTYEDIINNHWPKCGHHPVQCPNECGAVPKRQNIKLHLANDCPLTMIECDFAYVGCDVKLPRRSMPDHIRDGLALHFSKLALSHKHQQEELKSLKANHDKEIKMLKKEIDHLKSHLLIAPFPWVLNVGSSSWLNHIIRPGSSWPTCIVSHFYSHVSGYKLRLQGRLHGGVFNFTSYLLRGDFDDQLTWPCTAIIRVQLLGRDGENATLLMNKLRSGKRVNNVAYGELYGEVSIKYQEMYRYIQDYRLHIRIQVEF